MRRILAGVAIAAIVGVVAGGLAIVGGPDHARREKADLASLRYLEQLNRHLSCKEGDAVLPATLNSDTVRGFCENRNTNQFLVTVLGDVDPEKTTFTRLSDTEYRICAPYTDSLPRDRLPRYVSRIAFDPTTGCMTAQLPNGKP